MNIRFKHLLIPILIFSGIVFSQGKRLVNHISFTGNENIRDKTLISDLHLQPKKFLKGYPFKERALKLDVLSIKNNYIANGFLDVTINSETNIVNDRLIDITYHISEGIRYHLQNINVSGNEVLSTEELLKFLQFNMGDAYNPFQMSRFISEIEYLYFSKGKVLVKIDTEVVRSENTVSANIKIEEGDTFYVSDVTISGILNYPEKFILRELTFKNGDIYNIKEIEKSQSRVFSSGLFGSVEIRPVIGSLLDKNVTIEIKVREYSSKQIKTDIGLGQEPSSLGEGSPPASVLELDVKWQPGTIPKTTSRIEFGSNLAVRLDENITLPNLNYDITWFTPWVLGFRLPLRMRYYHNEQIDEKLDGVSSSFIYRTGERYKLSGSINLEFIESLVESDQKRSVQINYIEQRLNDFIYPSTGYFYSINTELNGTVLGGEVHFLKLDLEYKKFYPLDKNITFGIHHRVGYLHSINYKNENSDPLPPFYKFKLGGSTSLRGWRNTDEINSDGGMIRFQSNFEFRYPLFWLIGGELFLDMGKLADQFDKTLSDGWYWDVGTGITVNSPIGPVRTDVAFPQGNWSDPMVLLSILYLF